jgi:hypothetical protein
MSFKRKYYFPQGPVGEWHFLIAITKEASGKITEGFRNNYKRLQK